MDEYDLDLEELHDDDSFTKPTKPAAPKKTIEVGSLSQPRPGLFPHMLGSICASLGGMLTDILLLHPR